MFKKTMWYLRRFFCFCTWHKLNKEWSFVHIYHGEDHIGLHCSRCGDTVLSIHIQNMMKKYFCDT